MRSGPATVAVTGSASASAAGSGSTAVPALHCRGLVKRYGDLVAVDGLDLEVAAETVTAGDPSYVGPLAGVSLGLQVMHIFEDELKALIE